jgi:hypothetical protein
MKAALIGVVLGIAACSPGGSQSGRSNVDGSEQGRQAAFLALAHRSLVGRLTVVEVLRQGQTYVLGSRRLGCPAGRPTPIEDATERAELERALAVLDPKSLTERDPCRRPDRIGATWIVRARVHREITTRLRQFPTGMPDACADFQAAAERVMELAGLKCTHAGCLPKGRNDQDDGQDEVCVPEAW